jgi:hypothetical protein
MKPRINLCLFNHPFRYVMDQIWFVQQSLGQNGYEVSCTNTLRPDCINLLIENFVESDGETIEALCRKFTKQIGVIMTEHIELHSYDQFSFDGQSLKSRPKYIGEQRLFSLLSLADCVWGYVTLGEHPKLQSWSEIVPTHSVYRLPYPAICSVVDRPTDFKHDIVFTGTLTSYRRSVLNELGRKYRVVHSSIGDTEEKRAALYRRAKIAVNIPQDEEWRWVSPMRILFGLRCGVPTVHLGPSDTTMFCKQVVEPIDIDSALRDHIELFHRQIKAYKAFVESEHNPSFPGALFDTWSELELP